MENKIFEGPPGSGKTTMVIEHCNELIQSSPNLNILIIGSLESYTKLDSSFLRIEINNYTKIDHLLSYSKVLLLLDKATVVNDVKKVEYMISIFNKNPGHKYIIFDDVLHIVNKLDFENDLFRNCNWLITLHDLDFQLKNKTKFGIYTLTKI